MVLNTSLLNTQRYKVCIKGKVDQGVAPSSTPRCSSYSKGSLLVALDYGCQLYLHIYIYIFIYIFISVCVCVCVCVCARERERERVCVCVHTHIYIYIYIYTPIIQQNSFSVDGLSTAGYPICMNAKFFS